jgi:hypothetical protein
VWSDRIGRIPSIIEIESLSMAGEIEEIRREAADSAEIVPVRHQPADQ